MRGGAASRPQRLAGRFQIGGDRSAWEVGTAGGTRGPRSRNVKSGGSAGQGDIVAAFGCALAFWQPGPTCPLDNPLVFPAEGWVVGRS
jgi:hypothetical protein